MTTITREAALEALLATLGAATWGSPATGFGIKTRRNLAPEQMATVGSPGLALMVHHEEYERRALNLPPRRTITVAVAVYVCVGNDFTAIPDAVLNPIKDALDVALAPDNHASGFCTLGGAVAQCGIRGEVIQAPGDKPGYGLAIIPIDLVLP